MDEQSLTIQMEGSDNRDVRLDDFLDFLFDLRTVLRATDRLVAHSDEPTTTYSIGDLSHSSPATVVLRAIPREHDLDLRDRVLSTFVHGVASIQLGQKPKGFHTHLLLEFKTLAEHLKGELREASFSHGGLSAKVSSSFHRQLTEIIGPDRRERGEVSGMVDIVNAHQKRFFFWLFPAGGGERIKCFFGLRLGGVVGQAIRRYVTVKGTLQFKAGMLQPYAVTVADVDIHEPDAELPSLRELRGIAPGATDADSSEDYVRRLRDGW